MVFYHKGLQVHKTPLFCRLRPESCDSTCKIWPVHESDVIGLTLHFPSVLEIAFKFVTPVSNPFIVRNVPTSRLSGQCTRARIVDPYLRISQKGNNGGQNAGKLLEWIETLHSCEDHHLLPERQPGKGG